MDRYRATANQVTKPKSREWLDECFMNRVTRKVRKDSTISIDNVCYDVPMQFIGAKVEVRFLPDNMEAAYILHDDTRFPIRRTNRNENAHTKRQNQKVSIDYSKIGGGANV